MSFASLVEPEPHESWSEEEEESEDSQEFENFQRLARLRFLKSLSTTGTGLGGAHWRSHFLPTPPSSADGVGRSPSTLHVRLM